MQQVQQTCNFGTCCRYQRVSEDEIEGVREKIGYRNSLYVRLYKSCSFRCSGEYVCEEDYVASPIGKQTLFYIF